MTKESRCFICNDKVSLGQFLCDICRNISKSDQTQYRKEEKDERRIN